MKAESTEICFCPRVRHAEIDGTRGAAMFLRDHSRTENMPPRKSAGAGVAVI